MPSPYATPSLAQGNVDASVELLATEAVNMTGVEMYGAYAKEDQLIRDVTEAQRVIGEVRDWVFEIYEDDSTIVTIQGENTYDITAIVTALKYPLNYQGIISVKLGNVPLAYIEPDDMDEIYRYSFSSSLASQATAAATSIVLENSDSFPDNGTLYFGENLAVTYTANDKTTNTLSGIPASGDGSIGTTTPAGRSVFSGIAQSNPLSYTVFNGNMILSAPVSEQSAGINMKIRYYGRLPRMTAFQDETRVPFYHVIPYYLAYKIETRKRNYDDAKVFLERFTSDVALNKEIYKTPEQEEYTYYTLGDNRPFNVGSRDDSDVLSP